MKKLILIVAAFLMAISSIHAQWIPITKNQKLRKQYNKELENRQREGWDIVPFPGESPQNLRRLDQIDLNAVTNWGRDLLLPEVIRQRLVAECRNKVVIKIFDTSGKTSHVLLQQGQLAGASFTGEPSLEDGNGHGTHVAGIIAGDQGLGLLDTLIDVGIASWKPVKVLNNTGSGAFSWIANAINSEAVDNKRLLTLGTFVVCTASLGGGTDKVAEVETALAADVKNGTIWTVAAGNSSGAPVNYPGNSSYVIGIGSLDNTNPLVHSSYESVGPEIWTAMPGRSINSTYLNNGFATLSGTSMATPFQAAACAIALSKWGSSLANVDSMKAYLTLVAADLEAKGKDNYTGWGVDYIKAILDTKPNSIPPPPPPVDTVPPPPPLHTVRNLNFVVEGNFQMWWNNTGGLSEPLTFTSDRRKLRATSTDALTVTKLDITVPASTDLAPVVYDRIVAMTKKYFTGRGIMMPGVTDYNDAGYWTAYFYELILALQFDPKTYVDVNRIEFKDKNGKTGVLTGSELKHWKNTP